LTSRGVSFWRDADNPDDASAHRIFMGTNDARLIAIHSDTGKLCADFGSNGEVDLSADAGERRYIGEYQVTSPPAIAGDTVIVGSAVADNMRIDAPSGVVRGYDARSGELKWSWDLSPPDQDPPTELVSDAGYALGTPNVWAPMSVDQQNDLVFVPTGNPSPDYYGGLRNGNDYYGSSVVALRGSTGEVVWNFQTVHHDLWDFDVPAQPTLSHVVRDGEEIPVVIQGTKMGLVFVLNRETGEPIFDVEERPVPQSTVPGETTSPTQPFPVKPPPLVGTKLSKEDGWGPLGLGATESQEKIAGLHFEGMYTPPRVGEPTLMYPGNAGGTNWGGVAVDANRQILIANVLDMAWIVTLIPADEVAQARKDNPGVEIGTQEGTPYGMRREMLISSLELPCSAPPWGTLAAIDLSSGDILWQEPLGTVRDLAPVPIPIKYGTPNLGGPMITGSGLIFIGATMDNYIRAFNIDTGAELWKRRLPAGGQATPMTYRIAEDQPQMVVIAAGGHGRMGSKLGDYVVAFKLRSANTAIALWLLRSLLAILLILAVRRYLFPSQSSDEATPTRLARLRRHGSGLLAIITSLAAVGLVFNGFLPSQHWLVSISAVIVVVILAMVVLRSIAIGRAKSLAVAGGLLVLAGVVAYWEIGELFWVGVLPV
jgi:quinoprotein glucose dehydrogenase